MALLNRLDSYYSNQETNLIDNGAYLLWLSVYPQQYREGGRAAGLAVNPAVCVVSHIWMTCKAGLQLLVFPWGREQTQLLDREQNREFLIFKLPCNLCEWMMVIMVITLPTANQRYVIVESYDSKQRSVSVQNLTTKTTLSTCMNMMNKDNCNLQLHFQREIYSRIQWQKKKKW